MLPDALFLDEARANLDAMDAALGRVALASPDPEIIHALFRQAHSVKGGAAGFGWRALEELMQLIESVLEPWRKSGVAPGPQVVGLLRESARVAGQLLAAGDVAASAEQDLLDRLRNNYPAPTVERGARVRRIVVRLADAEVVRTAVTDLFADFAGLGELLSVSEGDDGKQNLLVRTECSDQELSDLLVIHVDRDAVTVGASNDAQGVTQPRIPADAALSDLAGVRVNAIELHRLTRLAHQLARDSQPREQGVLRPQVAATPSHGLVAQAHWHLDAKRLASGLDALCRAPASMLFSRIPPLLHHLSDQLQKQYVLTVVGEDTPIARALMQRLVDPLVHLVRNACDHGIELPDSRAKLGKPRVGHIMVSAGRESGELRIGVRDDGAGLSRDSVLRAARDRVMAVPENPDDQTIWQLVFARGLTTATAVTDVSGRGVGMDVVRSAIAAMGGTVEIESIAGLGTCVTMSIPNDTDTDTRA